MPGVEVRGLWNRTKARAELLARPTRTRRPAVYDDWRSQIGTANCDVISIGTAPVLRSDPLLAALDQGCHVLVEKRQPRLTSAGSAAFSLGLDDGSLVMDGTTR